MRVSKVQAAENRSRILDQAARLFRERGVAGVGVDMLAEAAGMTHGSVYSQFGSKDGLAAEAVRHAFASSAARLDAIGSFDDYAARYLTKRHRDAPGQGCTLAALGCEMARQSPAVRHSFTAGIKRTFTRLARLLALKHGGAADERAAMAALSTMVGALVLSRAVDDPALSEALLDAARAQLTGEAPG